MASCTHTHIYIYIYVGALASRYISFLFVWLCFIPFCLFKRPLFFLIILFYCFCLVLSKSFFFFFASATVWSSTCDMREQKDIYAYISSRPHITGLDEKGTKLNATGTSD
ncbi:hypothetical protein, unlikely [Trypanosoma brucei gambiense DAL972]|uniref:Uncharacterized protein n=1 Tax=Trypanosoma brucei gambiense (strain MHOM/CI/86/DAL972) TaxID=679716 RepID=C9ZSY7_TRYB9|nr:hypothetical protein, unlikely [Trypanosoma brucei gambiense DAL972]CBH12522.1 hypothetical protein, unlikely [Trypanosoma brucei gambiense DAL972]|eukprot:XP_011774802.1 hypothetical protein, unlikely [Trypanosoma brucei gambiense DAL972]